MKNLNVIINKSIQENADVCDDKWLKGLEEQLMNDKQNDWESGRDYLIKKNTFLKEVLIELDKKPFIKKDPSLISAIKIAMRDQKQYNKSLSQEDKTFYDDKLKTILQQELAGFQATGSKYQLVISHDKICKKVEFKNELPILYSANAKDKVIDILEKARENRSFVNITSGGDDGKSWGETNDTKGVIGATRGSEFRSPILINFIRGEEDEETGEIHGQDYDFLNELPTQAIADFLEENGLQIDEVLDYGGTLIDGDKIVAI